MNVYMLSTYFIIVTDRTNDLENKVTLLSGMSGGGGPSEDGKSGFIEALKDMIDNLKKECYAKF